MVNHTALEQSKSVSAELSAMFYRKLCTLQGLLPSRQDIKASLNEQAKLKQRRRTSLIFVYPFYYFFCTSKAYCRPRNFTTSKAEEIF